MSTNRKALPVVAQHSFSITASASCRACNHNWSQVHYTRSAVAFRQAIDQGSVPSSDTNSGCQVSNPRSYVGVVTTRLASTIGPGISPVAEVNSHITGTSYNTQIAIWIFNASDPRSNLSSPLCLAHLHGGWLDQGSVLAVRVFGSLSIYFTPQPETTIWGNY